MNRNVPNFIETIERYVEYKTCRTQILVYYDDFNCETCSEVQSCLRYRDTIIKDEVLLK